MNVTTEKLLHWSGAVSALAGLSVVAILASDAFGAAQTAVYALGTILAIFALTGIYAAQVGQSGLWGLAGYVFGVISEVLFMVEGSPQDPLAILAGVLYALALISLSIGTWRGGVFSKWVPGLWIAAIVIGMPGFAMDLGTQVFLIAGTLAFGLAYIVAGYELWTKHTVATLASGI